MKKDKYADHTSLDQLNEEANYSTGYLTDQHHQTITRKCQTTLTASSRQTSGLIHHPSPSNHQTTFDHQNLPKQQTSSSNHQTSSAHRNSSRHLQSSLDQQISSPSCSHQMMLSTSPNQKYSNHHQTSSDHNLSDSNQSPNASSTNHHGELCDKIRHEIRHFKEEFKEKFIKKKAKSPHPFKKNESNNSSDQEEERKCVTRIKINTNDEMDFLNLNHNYLSSNQLGSNVCPRNLSPNSLNSNINLSNHSLSSGHHQPESRSPFVNRALPPLPSKDRSSFGNLKASSSRSDYEDEPFVERKFDDESNEQKFSQRVDKSDDKNLSQKVSDKSHQKSGEKNSKEKFCTKSNEKKLNNQSNLSHENSDDDDEDSDLQVTSCFKLYKDKDHLKKLTKIKNIRNHLLPSIKKYAHPPPHLHSSSKSKVVHRLDSDDGDDDEEEDENNGNEANKQPAIRSRLINLNSNLINPRSDNFANLSSSAPYGQDELNSFSNRNNNSFERSKSSRKLSTDEQTRKMMDYAESVERVREQSWYWGALSGDKAEKLLEFEPEGSFIVRDSSDENYIFSLSFKLNNEIVHVRIEQDQGNFSFGSLQKFSSSTIVDFINEAVEYSRSGRYLFFLHRLPVIGPMRVLLLFPVSRFKGVQTLKHLARYTILTHVRRDHLRSLPLPDKLIKYLNERNYVSDEVLIQ